MLNAIITIVSWVAPVDGDPGVAESIILKVQDPADMENVRQFIREHQGKPVMLLSGEYLQESDSVGEFLELCCDKDPLAIVPMRNLYEEFKLFCIKEKGLREHHVRSMMSFSVNLRTRGFVERICSRRNYVKGLALNPDWREGGAV